MHTRFALLAALGAVCFGCVTPPEQPQNAAAGAAPANIARNTAPMPIRARAAITGSRLPPLDDDDPGPSFVGGMTGADWRGNEPSAKILCGTDPAACGVDGGKGKPGLR